MSSGRSLPEHLGSSVRHELDRLGGSDGMAAGLGEIVAAWPQAVGPDIAKNAWPARFARDHSLVVHASSSVWAFELAQLEQVVRERLGALAPPRLRFVVGPLPEAGQAPDRPVQDGSRAEPSTPGALSRATPQACAPEDVELRALVERAAAAALARERRHTGPADGSGTLRER